MIPNLCTQTDPFRVHDKIFGYIKEQQEEEIQFDVDGNIHIGSGVYCNPTAYYDSFKGKNPYKCLNLLTEGVYGLQELSMRCVRKQKNTLHKKPLSPIKTMAIERKVYTFMRMKDKTISQVDDFLDDINSAYHTAISSAKSRVARRLMLEQAEATQDEVINS